jgi:fluoride exporter
VLHVFLVGVGGFIGSVLRFGLSALAHRWVQNGFPVGTFAVNALGCLAVGAVWSLAEYRQWSNPELRLFLTAGFLGGFTTFSAFGHETFVLIRHGHYSWAVGNVLANVVIGIGAVIVGWLAAKAIVV